MTSLSEDKFPKTLRLLSDRSCSIEKSGKVELPVAIRDDYSCEWEIIGEQALTLQHSEMLRRFSDRFRAGAALLNRRQHVQPILA
jgi:hypothetical protein